MEAQGGAGSPELNKDVQKLLKPSSSGDLSRDLFQPPVVEEEGALSGPTAATLLHIAERRQPLSSVSSLEVHFDLLDLTELTDMSDQELAEVFVDSDEENHNDAPTGKTLAKPPVLPTQGSWDLQGIFEIHTLQFKHKSQTGCDTYIIQYICLQL
uniref:Dysbindin domain-containing protein 1 n=1 Tax=Neogobius melanostomus TaxID=47308 RepID=A0A8C6SNY6_9GOBI